MSLDSIQPKTKILYNSYCLDLNNIKTSFKKIPEYNNEITIEAVISVLSSIAIILVISFRILPLLALLIPIMVIGLMVFAKGIYDEFTHLGNKKLC